MATFSSFKKNLNALESKLKHLEVADITCNSARIIGEGASAVVSKQEHGGKIVAVKRFKQVVSKKTILNIANSLRALKNSHIVRFCGYSLRPSAILYEYCQVSFEDGFICHNLRALISNFNDHEYFILEERMNYLSQAITGLSFLHSSKIIHRDVKPSNMLVTGELKEITVKLSDFGEVSTIKDTCNTTLTNRTTNKLEGKNLSF